jgi:glycerophosphoryl diester phosphodiesterase
MVVAHRGASADEVENTMAAFRAAKEQGADGVELDVMRCCSGEVVVFHDDDLQRLAHRPGNIRELHWDELREVNLSGQRIPLLSEVLENLGDLAVNIELKSHPDWKKRLATIVRDDGLAAAVAGLIHRHGFEARALVSSFDPLLLMRFRAAAPEVSTGLLFAHDQSRPLREAWAAPVLKPTALHPESFLVEQVTVDEWRGRGYAINVWTVDEPAELRCLSALGVDAVITNRPSLARSVISST